MDLGAFLGVVSVTIMYPPKRQARLDVTTTDRPGSCNDGHDELATVSR